MRNNSVVYHCKRIHQENVQIELYEKPIKYQLRPMYLTIQPNNGSVYETTFGEFKDYSQKMCGSPYEFWDNVIKEGDLFYIDKGEPDGFQSGVEPQYGWGYDANYRVEKVAKQNRVIYYALKSVVE